MYIAAGGRGGVVRHPKVIEAIFVPEAALLLTIPLPSLLPHPPLSSFTKTSNGYLPSKRQR